MNSEWNRASSSNDDQKLWKINSHERPAGLAIFLPSQTYILPWCQFIYAEGRSEEVRLAFTTHDVVINGSRLDLLVPDLSAQRISQLRVPGRADNFLLDSGPIISGISVRNVESQ
jgi:hypothetical protein